MQHGRSIPYVSVAFFLSLKHNFIAYRSSKVSSRTDCIFEIHQLWQSDFSRVYSNSYCSCLFEPEIIKIDQSSHKMYSNDILNVQESTTILNACAESYWIHHVYIYIYTYIYKHVWLNNKDNFCRYNFIRILSSFLTSALVLGYYWLKNLLKLFGVLSAFYRPSAGVVCKYKDCFFFVLFCLCFSVFSFFLSPSSCRAIGTDISDLFSPLLPIVRRFRQVLRTTPRILIVAIFKINSINSIFFYMCGF